MLVALLLGGIAWRLGLPPLVGFLVSGFIFGAFGVDSTELLADIAEIGVLLLLFAVGLKLRFKTLLRTEVWGSGVSHLVGAFVIAMLALSLTAGLAVHQGALVALALTFSSTVLAAKVLDAKNELRAVHGRVAIGILIIQDIVAVAVLALISVSAPSPFAFGLLLLPVLRPIVYWLLDVVGHEELLVLFGAAAAVVIGGAGFAALGLSPELGALAFGVMLAGHRRAQELSNAIWGVKELLLVAFFLNVGLSGAPSMGAVLAALGLSLLLPLKGVLLFALLLAFGLRARTSFLTSISLTTYSEFAVIVTQSAVTAGLLAQEWLVIVALAVALSFVVAAPLNARAHELFARFSSKLERFERKRRHPDDEPISLGSAELLIVGMGRLGAGAYDYLHDVGASVVGADSDPGKLEQHLAAGRRVVYADAEDPSFWTRLNVDRLHAVMLTFPDLHAKVIAGSELRRRGYKGLLSATYIFPEERKPILAAGFDAAYNYFTEAGVGFARDTAESLVIDARSDGADEPDAQPSSLQEDP